MKFRKGIYLVIVCMAGMVFSSCSVSRYLPADSYMLTKNKVKVDKEAPKEERLPAKELNKYVRQSPSKRFIGTNLSVWVYNQADPEKDNGWNKFLRRVGSEPVILDSAQAEVSTRNIKLYMDTRGFRDSESDFDVKYNQRKRTAKVTYKVSQGRPSRIASLDYDFRDDFLGQVIGEVSDATLLAEGDIFDITVLNQERLRIQEYLQNMGYYNFSIDNIKYVADTTAGDHLVDVTMRVQQYVSGYDQHGEPILENHSIYRLNDIYVYPAFDSAAAAVDSTYTARLDTAEYRGLKIVTDKDNKSKMRPATLRRTINIYPDYLYSKTDVNRAYNNIIRLGYYRSANILFSEAPPDEESTVTFVGGEEDDAVVHTSEKALDCNIYCTPGLQQGYNLSLEGTQNSSYYGIRASAGYSNRNLFHGAEIFDISLAGGYEFYRNNRPNAFEIGGAVSITFPRFFAPLSVDRANRLNRPQTKFELSLNYQNRPVYKRTISGVGLSYSWSDGKYNTYTFRPLEINLVKVSYLDREFIENDVTNQFLRESYRSQIINAIGFSYVHNNPRRNARGNSLTFRANFETAGNLSNLIASAVSEKRPYEDLVPDEDGNIRVVDRYLMFGVPISQYVRLDASIANTIKLGETTAVAWRVFAGAGIAYGNVETLPMDRLFYVGGANSMRGWPVRRLGPGNTYVDPNQYPNQLGNMRLEANLEFRFPIWGSLHGATFFDLGNIWLLNMGGSDMPGTFRFNKFYEEVGFNSGFGLRFDLGITVIRLDLGVRIYDPSQLPENRWIRKFNFNDWMALNLGVGYPF